MKTAYPLQWMAGLVSVFLPELLKQEKKNIVLTSFHGDGYRGNAKVIFEHLCNHDYFRPVWLSRNRDIVRKITSDFGFDKAALAHSVTGLKKLASASAILFTHGTSDYPFLRLPRHALKIQTYHGLPTKRGEYLRPRSEDAPNFLYRLLFRYRFRPIDCFLSSSPLVTNIFSRRFGLPVHCFEETGYPAMDRLVHATGDRNLIKEHWPDAPDFRRVILYSPTFRRFSRTRWFPFEDFDPESLSCFLEREKILLLMRPHPNEPFDISGFRKYSKRILDAGHNVIEDVYSILLISDIIITDYSSIYIEGLLRDIPGVFIPYDIDSYERGLPFDYNTMTPGDKVHSQTQFLQALESSLHDKTRYKRERERVCNLFFSSTRGDSAQKVTAYLEKKLMTGTGGQFDRNGSHDRYGGQFDRNGYLFDRNRGQFLRNWGSDCPE